MINPSEATGYLLENLPELSHQLPAAQPSIYQTIYAFVRFTGNKVKEHNYKTAKQCFQLADRLYARGNALVRSAIENVYIFSLDKVCAQLREERSKVHALIPGSLYSVYIRQIMRGGC